MKKILSLVLVFMMLVSLCPTAYADNDAAPASDPFEDFILQFIKVTEIFFTDKESEGIVKSDGHLFSCNGDDCSCLEIILVTELEARQRAWEEDLRVWIKSSRDEELALHDLVVAEVERPYNLESRLNNEDYLNNKEAVKELLKEFFDEEELGEYLYRPTDFINSQVFGSCNYIESDRSGSKIHVEYRLMDLGPAELSVPGINFLDEDKGDGAENYVFSCDSFVPEGFTVPEFDMHLRAGNVVIGLPESCFKAGFTLALSFNENGSVRVLLADDDGKLIPGAAISAVMPDGAADSAKAAVVSEGGGLTAIDDSTVKNGSVFFSAPTGDDVFVLADK